MRLHAFRSIYSDDERIESTRSFQETSIRTMISEDLHLPFELLGLFKKLKMKSIYSHLRACKWPKTSIQKNTRGFILRKQENG